MPFIKSRNPTPFRAYGSTPTSYSATINYSRGRKIIQEGGQCYKCTKLLFVCIISLVAPPIVIGWFLCNACCTFAGRNRFINVLKECYYLCCFKIDCLEKISLYEAISRYEEDPPMEPKVFIN